MRGALDADTVKREKYGEQGGIQLTEFSPTVLEDYSADHL